MSGITFQIRSRCLSNDVMIDRVFTLQILTHKTASIHRFLFSGLNVLNELFLHCGDMSSSLSVSLCLSEAIQPVSGLRTDVSLCPERFPTIQIYHHTVCIHVQGECEIMNQSLSEAQPSPVRGHDWLKKKIIITIWPQFSSQRVSGPQFGNPL